MSLSTAKHQCRFWRIYFGAVPKSRARATEQLKRWVDLYPPVATGAQAILSSSLVGTWTAFETLAGDLWVKTVNQQPQYLAGLTGSSNRIDSLAGIPATAKAEDQVDEDEDEESENSDDICEPVSDKKVALGLMCRLTRGDYNLSEKMGDLLVIADRVKFTSLKAIREAYSLAFPEKVRGARSQRIDTSLKNKSLDALSAVRNLIVHKSGRADTVYAEDCKNAPGAPKLNKDECLQLDGKMCQALIEPVVKISNELVSAVDSWLTLSRR